MADAPPAELVRFLKTAGAAFEAFWDKVSEAYPEVTSGDMAPGEVDPLELAMVQTLQVWLWNNHPNRELAAEIICWKTHHMDQLMPPYLEPVVNERVWA